MVKTKRNKRKKRAERYSKLERGAADSSEVMADYYMLAIMVHLCNRGTKNEPEHKELIWVAR